MSEKYPQIPDGGLWGQINNDIYNLNSGKIGIGTNTPASNLEVKHPNIAEIRATGGDITGYSAYQYSNLPSGMASPGYVGYRARGDESTPGAILDGDAINSLIGYGYDGTTFGISTYIIQYAVGNFSESNHGANIGFATAENGTAPPFPSIRMTVAHDGNVGVGIASPAEKLVVYNGTTLLNRLTNDNTGAKLQVTGLISVNDYLVHTEQLIGTSDTTQAIPQLLGAQSLATAGVVVIPTAVAAIKADLNLGTLAAGNLDTVVEATNTGSKGNNITIEADGSGGPGTGVVITVTGDAVLITYESGVSTVLDVENAINSLTGSNDIIAVKTIGTPGTILNNATDNFAATSLAGGSALENNFYKIEPNGNFIALANLLDVNAALELHIDKTGGVVDNLYFWIEQSTDSGLTWTHKSGTLREETIADDGAWTNLLELSQIGPVTEGTIFRSKVARGNATGTLSIQKPADFPLTDVTLTSVATKLILK